jgi:ribosome maturation factor RimP
VPAAELERLRAIAERVARDQGLEVFDVQLRRESVGWVLRVILDRHSPFDAAPLQPGVPVQGGVGIDDCQRVSHELSAILDVEDVVDQKYLLEVSSPGLDRPLRHAADYQRFTGRKARFVLHEPIDGQKLLIGRLKGVEDEAVLLEGGRGQVHRIPVSAIARARLEVEF